MEKKSQNKHEDNGGSKMVAGVGLAALAAAAAGAIFLYGTDAGKKRRKQMESWMLRMKADVIDRMSKMKDWSEDSYKELIDTVAARYEGIKNIDKDELTALVFDLKRHWKNLKREAEAVTKTTSKPKRKALPKAKSESKTEDSQ